MDSEHGPVPDGGASPGPEKVTDTRAGEGRSLRRRGQMGLRFGAPAALGAAILLLLGAGAAAAFTVPVFSANATRSVAEMLPASTVFYVSADLNPTGQKRANLDRIVHAFTDQPGWSGIAQAYNSTRDTQSTQGDCVRQTQDQVSAHLSDLGHDTALALTDTPKSSGTGGIETGFKQNLVVVAPLHVQRTLVQALSGLSLKLPQSVGTYRGTTIYAETFHSCGQATANTAQTVYAALVKNYVLLGLLPEALHSVIDVSTGTGPSLASTTAFRALASQLRGDHLAGYYVNGDALNHAGFLQSLSALSGRTTVVRRSSYNSALKPVAGALFVEPGGFRLTGAAFAPTGATHRSGAAGALAAHLPDDVLALISVQGLADSVRSGLQQQSLFSRQSTRQIGEVLRQIASDATGESDIVLFRPAGSVSLNASGVTAPLAVLWRVGSQPSAQAHLADAVRRLNLNRQLVERTALDGTRYRATTQGYGYAVRGGWAIVSLDIAHVLGPAFGSPGRALASVPAYRSAVRPGTTPSARWYVNFNGLRQVLERSFLQSAPANSASQYREYVMPVLAPVQTFSGSAGTTAGGAITVSNMVIAIRHQ